MRRTLLALCLALAVTGGVLAQSFSTLEERMSAADFQRFGLDKLSAEELAALNAWLQQDTSRRSATAPAQDSQLGFPRESPFDTGDGTDRIVSSIQGEFRGWAGADELFTLANGQVWRSTDSATRLRVRLQDPRVVIERGVLGAWFLRVDGYNTRVRVQRVK